MKRIEHDIFGEEQRKPTINSKRKGNANERLAAKCLKEWTGLEFNRVPNSGGLRWKNAEGITGDLVCEDKTFPFVVETKHYKKLPMKGELRSNSFVYKVYRQCKRDADRAKKAPLLMLRENNMRLGEFVIYFDLKLNELPKDVIPFSVGIKGNLCLTGYSSKDLLGKVSFKNFFVNG